MLLKRTNQLLITVPASASVDVPEPQGVVHPPSGRPQRRAPVLARQMLAIDEELVEFHGGSGQHPRRGSRRQLQSNPASASSSSTGGPHENESLRRLQDNLSSTDPDEGTNSGQTSEPALSHRDSSLLERLAAREQGDDAPSVILSSFDEISLRQTQARLFTDANPSTVSLANTSPALFSSLNSFDSLQPSSLLHKLGIDFRVCGPYSYHDVRPGLNAGLPPSARPLQKLRTITKRLDWYVALRLPFQENSSASSAIREV